MLHKLQAGKGCVSRTEPTIRVPASGLSQRSVPEARILWLEAKVTLIFAPSEIGVGMEAQVPCGGSHPPFPCRAIFCLVIPVNLFQSSCPSSTSTTSIQYITFMPIEAAWSLATNIVC